MATNKCPYCYSVLGTWTDDPILVKDGSQYRFINDTELQQITDIAQRFYKGLIIPNTKHIKELQDNRINLEEELLAEIDRTVFSPINDTGEFQIFAPYIKELRESTEKILEALGLTKEQYFNYDEEGNTIIHPLGNKLEWTDNVTVETDWNKFQVKAIHIEDLRHFIESWILRETWQEAALWTDTWIASTFGSYSNNFNFDADNPNWNADFEYSMEEMITASNYYANNLSKLDILESGSDDKIIFNAADMSVDIGHQYIPPVGSPPVGDYYIGGYSTTVEYRINYVPKSWSLIGGGKVIGEGNLNFTIQDLTFNVNANYGNDVILVNPYFVFGVPHNSQVELDALKNTNTNGGYIRFTIKLKTELLADKFLHYGIKTNDLLGWGVVGTVLDATFPRNIYNDYVSVYGFIDPDIFAQYQVYLPSIEIYGIASSLWVGQVLTFHTETYAYTDESSLDLTADFGDIRFYKSTM